MSTEPVRIEFALQNDPRLLEGASTIFAHAAKQAGFPDESRQEFSMAALNKCREAFAFAKEKGRQDSAIHILLGEFPDRIEITIEYPGDLSPAASIRCGRECVTGNGAGANSALGKEIFDSVEGQSSGGLFLVKVIKYVGAEKPKTKAR